MWGHVHRWGTIVLSTAITFQNACPWGQVTVLRSKGIIFWGLKRAVALPPNHEQDAEVAMATAARKKGEMAVGARGLPVQMPANRPPCLESHESCRKCRQLPSSPHPTHPPFPLPSVKHTHTHPYTHIRKDGTE